MKEYRVLRLRDGWLFGRLDPGVLADELNLAAAENFRAVTAFAHPIVGLGRRRDEIIVVLERELPPKNAKEESAEMTSAEGQL